MAQALEWFQCPSCGRRQRWTAEIAGRLVACSCGKEILCPKGLAIGESVAAADRVALSGSFTDTLVESVDDASAVDPLGGFDTMQGRLGVDLTGDEAPPTVEELRARKSFLVWGGLMLLGLSMLIHALITQWPVYIVLAVLLFPLSAFKFNSARRRFQRGRKFGTAVIRALGG
ncbi:MAG: hypothetical protein SFZ24_02165 [Planctomycetota bacterium]|nr:hypothetical protein [Planctomycetota bacterium]